MSIQPDGAAGSAAVAGCCTTLARDPLSASEAEELGRRFKALGDPVRLRLLSLIASHRGGEACVCELTVGSRCPGGRSRTTCGCCARPA